MFLRQSTSQVIRFGPCLDRTDAEVEETALTLAQADMRLSKDGGAFAQKNASGNATHDSDGWYSTTLDTTDTDTVGELILNVHQPSEMRPVSKRYWVLEEAIYDAMFGASATGLLPANVTQISGDSTAADNLEATYDGTGYTDDAAPASQSQVSGIGAGSGSALNFPVSADNTAGAIIDGVTFIGTQTGTFANTEQNLETFHQIDDSGNAIDLVYQVACGDTHTGVSFVIDTYLNSLNDELTIQVYDHVGADWEDFSILDGTNGSNITEIIGTLFEKHTGALGTSEAGNVYLRFVTSAQSNPTLFIARVYVSAVPATATLGYEAGSVYCDEDNGASSGTTQGLDGTFANQSDDLDNAQTIADNLGTSTITIHPGNSITLTTALQGYTINNIQATLNGGSQNVDSTRINGGFLVGTFARAGTGIPTFSNCNISSVTSDRVAILNNCGLIGTFTLSEAGLYPIVDAQAGGPTGISTIDFASLGGATVNMERWSGNLTITNMAAGDTLNLHATAGGDIIIGGVDGTVYVSGVVGSLTDNRTGSPTLTDNHIDPAVIAAIETDTQDIQSRLPTALVSGKMDSDVTAISGDTTAADNLEAGLETVVTLTVQSGSTAAVIETDLTEATDNHYVGRYLFFRTGALAGQALEIIGYNGTTNALTVTNQTADIPANTDLAVIL